MIDTSLIKQASLLCLNLYDSDPIKWDHFDDGSDDDKICWAIKRIDDIDYVILRGSVTTTDWLRDFNAWANPFHKTDIGHVHPGFLLGMEQVWSEAEPITTSSGGIVLVGHSLGAARADILCSLMVRDGVYPKARIVFGEPKPGFADFAEVISVIDGASYCCGDDYGHDLITEMPFSFPPEEYVHPTPLISVRGSPPRNDPWSAFRYHHFALYNAAVQNS